MDMSIPVTRSNEIDKARECTWQVGLVYRIIKMKVEFASAGFEPVHEDEKVEKFYKDLYEDLDMSTFIRAAAFEHEVVGEWYPFYTWNNNGTPDNITILNPKLVEPHSILGENILIFRPTSNYHKLVNHKNEKVRQQVKEVIPDYIFSKWKDGQEVVLEEENCQRYTNLKAYHENEVNSPLKPIFGDIELLNTLQEGDFATAKKLKQSILQVKVGNKDYEGGKAIGKDKFEDVMEQFNDAIEGYSTMEWFTQWFVDAEYIIPDMEVFSSEKYESVMNRIINWSGLNVMVDQDGGSYGQAYVRLKGLRQEIKNTRKVIKKALNDFNKKIAEKNNLTYYKNLKVPDIKFNSNALEDDSQVREFIKFLYKHGLLSAEDALGSMGYDMDRQMRKKENEEDYKDEIQIFFEPSQGLTEQARQEDEDIESSRPQD